MYSSITQATESRKDMIIINTIIFLSLLWRDNSYILIFNRLKWFLMKLMIIILPRWNLKTYREICYLCYTKTEGYKILFNLTKSTFTYAEFNNYSYKTYPTWTNMYVTNLHTSILLCGSYINNWATGPSTEECPVLATSQTKSPIWKHKKSVI